MTAPLLLNLERLETRISESVSVHTGDVLTVGIDGASASGKSSLAAYLAALAPGLVTVVHTDDIAWHHSFFGWHQLCIDEILLPVRRGRLPLHYRPPGWIEKGRAGGIDIPSTTRVLVVEGVGATHRSMTEHLDVGVWVETSIDIRAYRQERRLQAGIDDEAFMVSWNAQERRFLVDDMPWTRVEYMISGNDARLRQPQPVDLGEPARLVNG
ncbi:hypothetical protein [Gordonia polyisoprenivorans]|uniref:hypothetical protein n=1 Tax=Gordonia polyisoprenivorans TaxID=84595 RepID=UPI0003780389|nr:hypothetical protein [Gordonia polyisoprenivorans]